MSPVATSPARRWTPSRIAIHVLLAFGVMTTLATSPPRWNVRGELPPLMVPGGQSAIDLVVEGDSKTFSAFEGVTLQVTFVDVEKATAIRRTRWTATLGPEGGVQAPLGLAEQELVGTAYWHSPQLKCPQSGPCRIPLRVTWEGEPTPPLQVNIEFHGYGMGSETPGGDGVKITRQEP